MDAPQTPHRKPTRLPGYDYTQAGGYFVTLVTSRRECIFGHITHGLMHLNPFGEIIAQQWMRIPWIRPNVQLDAWVVMPNHVHGVLLINDENGIQRKSEVPGKWGDSYTSLALVRNNSSGLRKNSLGAIVGQIKSVTTQKINLLRGTPGAPVWQRNYHDHIIRNEKDLLRIREYIESNPARWESDSEYPP